MAWTVQNEFVPGTVGMACYVCKCDLRPESPTGQDGHEVALDTGIMIDFEGYVALCESCIIEAGHLIGLAEPAKVAALELELEETQFDLLRVMEERNNALTAVEALMRLPAPSEAVEVVVPAEVVEQAAKRPVGRPKKQA